MIRNFIDLLYDKEETQIVFNTRFYNGLNIYDLLSLHNLKKMEKFIAGSQYKAVDVTANLRNYFVKKFLNKNEYTLKYDYYKWDIKKDKKFVWNNNVVALKNRDEVIDMLKIQQKECAKRMPEIFNKEGEIAGWLESGDELLVYKIGDEIASVITFSEYFPPNCKQQHIHMYLGYTSKKYRRLNLCSILINHIKEIARVRKNKYISSCTDTSSSNYVQNVFIMNKFKYFKSSFIKVFK